MYVPCQVASKCFLGKEGKKLKVSVQQHDIRCDTTANPLSGKQMWEASMISCLLRSDLSCDYECFLPSGDMDI